METTPPREPSPSHPLSVLRCPSQTGTTALSVCGVCFNYYHFPVSLEKVQLRATSEGIMFLNVTFLTAKALCVCDADFVLSMCFVYSLTPPSSESESQLSKKKSVLPKIITNYSL